MTRNDIIRMARVDALEKSNRTSLAQRLRDKR